LIEIETTTTKADDCPSMDGVLKNLVEKMQIYSNTSKRKRQ
jgi:hypothetical protein